MTRRVLRFRSDISRYFQDNVGEIRQTCPGAIASQSCIPGFLTRTLVVLLEIVGVADFGRKYVRRALELDARFSDTFISNSNNKEYSDGNI